MTLGSSAPTVNWDLVHLKCGDCGADLVVTEGRWGCFYSCSAYPKCYNRMNVDIYEKILDELTEQLLKNPNTNLTNHQWRFKTGYQHYQFKIEKEIPGKYIVSALNMKKRKVRY